MLYYKERFRQDTVEDGMAGGAGSHGCKMGKGREDVNWKEEKSLRAEHM